MKQITVLNFSPRSEGNCTAISSFISEHYALSNICANQFREEFSPCGNCDYECLRPGVNCPGIPEALCKVMDSMLESDLVYFIVPNFCGGPCGNYYAFNERTVGYFNMDRALMGRYMAVKKKFIFVSNTECDSFVQATRQHTKEEPEILYLKTGKYKKQSIAGDMMTTEEAQADLKAFLNA